MSELSFEIMALAMLLILEYIYLIDYRRLPIMQTKLFMAFLQLSIIADVVNAGFTRIRTSGYQIPDMFSNVYTIFYYLLTISLFPTFAIYIYEIVAKEEWRYANLKKRLMYIPLTILAILLVVNVFCPFMYHFEGNQMVVTPWIYLARLMPFGYLALILVISVIRYKKFTKQQFRIVMIYIISTTLVFLISSAENGSMLCGISSGLSLMVAYVYVQNPELYIDSETKVYNEYGFSLYIRDHYLHKKDFQTVVISLAEYKSLHLLTNMDNMKLIMQEFATWCKSLSRENRVFRIAPSIFVLCMEDEVIADGVYEKIKQTMVTSEDEQEPMINKLDGNVFLLLNCKQYKTTEQFTARIALIAEYEDPLGKKHYFRNTEIEKDLERKQAVEAAVGRAINQESFEMFFQPVYDINQKCFNKAEALIRLKDEKLGFIPPDEFITLAEQKGYIRKITRQVIRKTLHAMNEYRFADLGVDSININLSTRDMWEGDLKQYLPEVMQEENIPPSMVTLEITETAAGNRELASDFMNKMVSLGYRFAVDDYGTGYSNIERTISLPFDSIKIDKTLFYMAVEREKIRYHLDHTIAIFHDMGFSVVVEGAETEEHIKILHDMKIDYIQGYYYSKPLPIQEYIAYLKKNNQKVIG